MEEILFGTSLLAQIDMEIEQGRVKLYKSRVNIGSQLTYCHQSIGLFRFGLPEIVLFGIDSEAVLGQVIDYLVDEAIQGRPAQVEGLLPTEYFSRNAYGIEVHRQYSKPHCELIYSYYEVKGLQGPRIVQWVFSDDAGRFPWHPAADKAVTSVQMLLMNNVS